MGRKANNHGQKRRNQPAFLVKIRIRGNRIKSNGTMVQGGVIKGRNVYANNPEHAKSRVCGKGTIIGVRKIQPEHLVKSVNRMHLQDVIGIPTQEKKKDVILDNISLSEIVFGQKQHQKEEERHINRRLNADISRYSEEI